MNKNPKANSYNKSKKRESLTIKQKTVYFIDIQ